MLDQQKSSKKNGGNYGNEKKLLLTGVWQNEGRSANLNFCASISAPSTSRKTLCVSLKTPLGEINKIQIDNFNLYLFRLFVRQQNEYRKFKCNT